MGKKSRRNNNPKNNTKKKQQHPTTTAMLQDQGVQHQLYDSDTGKPLTVTLDEMAGEHLPALITPTAVVPLKQQQEAAEGGHARDVQQTTATAPAVLDLVSSVPNNNEQAAPAVWTPREQKKKQKKNDEDTAAAAAATRTMADNVLAGISWNVANDSLDMEEEVGTESSSSSPRQATEAREVYGGVSYAEKEEDEVAAAPASVEEPTAAVPAATPAAVVAPSLTFVVSPASFAAAATAVVTPLATLVPPPNDDEHHSEDLTPATFCSPEASQATTTHNDLEKEAEATSPLVVVSSPASSVSSSVRRSIHYWEAESSKLNHQEIPGGLVSPISLLGQRLSLHHTNLEDELEETDVTDAIFDENTAAAAGLMKTTTTAPEEHETMEVDRHPPCITTSTVRTNPNYDPKDDRTTDVVLSPSMQSLPSIVSRTTTALLSERSSSSSSSSSLWFASPAASSAGGGVSSSLLAVASSDDRNQTKCTPMSTPATTTSAAAASTETILRRRMLLWLAGGIGFLLIYSSFFPTSSTTAALDPDTVVVLDANPSIQNNRAQAARVQRQQQRHEFWEDTLVTI